jgi:hypothetical protein
MSTCAGCRVVYAVETSSPQDGYSRIGIFQCPPGEFFKIVRTVRANSGQHRIGERVKRSGRQMAYGRKLGIGAALHDAAVYPMVDPTKLG